MPFQIFVAYFNGDTFLVFVWNPIFAFVHKRDLSYVVPSFNPLIITWLIYGDFFADLFKSWKLICKVFSPSIFEMFSCTTLHTSLYPRRPFVRVYRPLSPVPLDADPISCKFLSASLNVLPANSTPSTNLSGDAPDFSKYFTVSSYTFEKSVKIWIVQCNLSLFTLSIFSYLHFAYDDARPRKRTLKWFHFMRKFLFLNQIRDLFKTQKFLQHWDEDPVRSNCCWLTSSAEHCVPLFLYENDKSEVPPPQNSCNISEKERKIILRE